MVAVGHGRASAAFASGLCNRPGCLRLRRAAPVGHCARPTHPVPCCAAAPSPGPQTPSRRPSASSRPAAPPRSSSRSGCPPPTTPPLPPRWTAWTARCLGSSRSDAGGGKGSGLQTRRRCCACCAAQRAPLHGCQRRRGARPRGAGALQILCWKGRFGRLPTPPACPPSRCPHCRCAGSWQRLRAPPPTCWTACCWLGTRPGGAWATVKRGTRP